MKNPDRFGTCYKLSGKRRRPWIARAYMGKYKGYKTIGYYRTKTEGMNALIEYNRNPYDLDMANLTFGEVFKRVKKEKEKDLKPITIKDNYVLVNDRFFAPIQNEKFKDLRPYHYQIIFEEYEDYKRSYIQKPKVLLSVMYKWAMMNDIVSVDYSKGVVARGKDTEAQAFFTQEELKWMINNMYDYKDLDIVVILCLTGLRPTELLNLSKDNVDLDNRMIREVGIKTKAGKRKRVPIANVIHHPLEMRYEEADNYLFTKKDGSKMEYYYFYESVYKPIFKGLQVEYKSPKACRHTFANITHGRLSDKARTSIIGHTDVSLTNNVYTDLEDKVLWDEFVRIDKFLTNF